MRDKKGLSTVVTTLIIVLLVIVAVGIVWVVVQRIINTGTETADIAAKCLGLDILPMGASCTMLGGGVDNCTVTIRRTATSTSQEIDGLRLSFSNEAGDTEDRFIVGNLISSKTETFDLSGGNIVAKPTKIDITAYFEDEDGEKQYCSNSVIYNIPGEEGLNGCEVLGYTCTDIDESCEDIDMVEVGDDELNTACHAGGAAKCCTSCESEGYYCRAITVASCTAGQGGEHKSDLDASCDTDEICCSESG